jgi:hypothetical protein
MPSGRNLSFQEQFTVKEKACKDRNINADYMTKGEKHCRIAEK